MAPWRKEPETLVLNLCSGLDQKTLKLFFLLVKEQVMFSAYIRIGGMLFGRG